MTLTIIILLIFIGLVMLVLEILVVPGGILGIISLAIMAFGIYLSYVNYGSTAGHITLASTVAGTLLIIGVSLKTGAWNYFANKTVLEGKMNVIDETLVKAGDVGICISELRPMGTALFNDERMEVTTEGEQIPVRTPVKVIRIENNKIFVTRNDK